MYEDERVNHCISLSNRFKNPLLLHARRPRLASRLARPRHHTFRRATWRVGARCRAPLAAGLRVAEARVMAGARHRLWLGAHPARGSHGCHTTAAAEHEFTRPATCEMALALHMQPPRPASYNGRRPAARFAPSPVAAASGLASKSHAWLSCRQSLGAGLP